MVKIEGYEEISEEEYIKLPGNEGVYINDHYTKQIHYFKKAQKSQRCPDVFIERAAQCTREGIQALCGTDEEYSKYVKKLKKGKAQKFPICFALDSNHKINVLYDGEMECKIGNEVVFVILPEEIPKFIKAVEKAKEVMKKNENKIELASSEQSRRDP